VDFGKVTEEEAMHDSVREFLTEHPTTGKWLDDIIEVLISRRGTAHVKVIANDLVKSNKTRDKDTAEEIVTRTINDFCSDAADFEKGAAHDLFQRVEPATYRLRAYPERPTLIELMRIEFDDPAMQSMWDWFRQLAKKKHPQSWQRANNEKKLSEFVKWMARDQINAEYHKRKATYSSDGFDTLFGDD
jgi:hypothetical protein